MIRRIDHPPALIRYQVLRGARSEFQRVRPCQFESGANIKRDAGAGDIVRVICLVVLVDHGLARVLHTWAQARDLHTNNQEIRHISPHFAPVAGRGPSAQVEPRTL